MAGGQRSAEHLRTAVLYARVSSKEQERGGFSIPAQLRLLRTYAAANGITVSREFLDVETAKDVGRIGFNEMIKLLSRTPERRVLLVEKTDRLYRNIRDWVTLDEIQLEIHFVKENLILSANSRSSEKFIHGMKVLMAKNYIDNLSEETRKGMDEKARQGFWPSYAPLGYRNVQTSNGKRIIEIDPMIGPQISQLFQWYATGLYSLKEVTGKAKDAGMLFRKTGSFVPRATIHNILRNLIYTGTFEWNGKLYQGLHEPLVSRELWDRVQEALRVRLARRHRRVKHDFAYSGLIRCGQCGCAFVGEIKKSKYVYYHCTGYRGKCRQKYSREADLSASFGEILSQIHIDPELAEWICELLKKDQEIEQRAKRNARVRTDEQIARLQSRIDGMYVDKLDGKVQAEFFERKKAEWEAEQIQLLKIVQDDEQIHPAFTAGAEQLLRLASKIPQLFKAQAPREKRRILNVVLSNSVWHDGVLTGQFRQPFDLLRDARRAAESTDSYFGTASRDFENWLPGLDSN